MIRIELDEFSIDVPIEKRMTVQQFLAIADRLERISKRQKEQSGQWGEPVYNTHETMGHSGFQATQHDAHPHDFSFEHESAARRTEILLERVNRRLDGLSEMQSRLERLEHRFDERR